MNFIEIYPGKNIRKNEIIDIEYVDDMSCKISTQIDTYDCSYPSWRVLMLLEKEDIEEKISTVQPIDKPDTRSLFGNGQYFAG